MDPPEVPRHVAARRPIRPRHFLFGSRVGHDVEKVCLNSAIAGLEPRIRIVGNSDEQETLVDIFLARLKQ